jgi:tRNA A37 threonylcarbamoyladenosine dehydratase
VILFGVGGVGSWCAQALIRTGVVHLTVVDSDVVCVTNVNRQAQAVSGNIGRVKVDELKNMLLAINPDAEITALRKIYSEETRNDFGLDACDYIIDAIDSISCKVDLIDTALKLGKKIYSSMGAACKLDPSRIKTASIWKTSGCPLARQVRKGLRKRNAAGDFLCVYSDEALPNHDTVSACGTGDCYCPKMNEDGGVDDTWCGRKAVINGSLVHITGTFGFHLAGLVIRDVAGSVTGDML